MNKRAGAFSATLPRPPKRLRRTATTVLAGYFDPRPHRDYFTDMANSSDSQSPYNSVVGRGPGILFDIRSQEEKDREIAREQKRLLKNAKRREKDIEKRKEKQEQKFRKAQRRVARVQTIAHAKPAHRTDMTQVEQGAGRAISPPGNSEESGTLVTSASRTGATHPPSDLAVGSQSFLPGSPERSPCDPTASGDRSPSSRRTFIYNSFTASPPRDYLQTGSYSHPVVDLTPARGATPPVVMSSEPSASAALIASPPTPSRSIFSVTSHTSSRRPHTPKDHQMSPAPTHSGSHADFEAYSPMDIDQAECVLGHDPAEGRVIDKMAVAMITAAAPEREPFDCVPRSPTDTGYSTKSPYDEPTWFSPQSPRGNAEAGSNNPWESAYFSASHTIESGSPGIPQPSISHRRDALSLAALLSPSIPPHRPPRLGPSISSILETTKLLEPCDPSVPQDEISGESATDHRPEPSVAASWTVESACLSPLALASPLNGEIAPSTVGELPEQMVNEITPPLDFEHSFTSAMDTTKTVEELQVSVPAIGSLGPAMELESSEAIDEYTINQESEGSATPEPDRKNQGRASKAMLVFQSEDDCTDFEDLDITDRCKFTKSGNGGSAIPDKSMGDGFSLSKSTTSPAASVGGIASKKRKRAAAKKGWKGWVEVEVDEDHHVAPKQFSLDILPPGERRTRSGRQFDG